MTIQTRFTYQFAVLGLLGLVGCSQSGPKTIPVYGKIEFVGREAPKVCRLLFKPLKSDGPARPSVAERGADGSYQVKAYKGSKGLLPGTYQVAVSYFDLKPGKDPNLETSWAETGYDAGELVVDSTSRGIEHNIEVPGKS